MGKDAFDQIIDFVCDSLAPFVAKEMAEKTSLTVVRHGLGSGLFVARELRTPS